MCNWALAVKGDRRDMKPVLQDYNSVRHRTFPQCHATRVQRPCTTKHHYMKHNRSILYLYGKNHTDWTPRTNTRTQPLCPCYRLSGSKTLDPLPLFTTRNVCFPAISRFAAHDDNKRFFHFPPPNNFQCFSNSLVAIFFKQFSCPTITLLEELKHKKKVTCVYNLFSYIENSCFGEMGLRSNFRSAYSNS